MEDLLSKDADVIVLDIQLLGESGLTLGQYAKLCYSAIPELELAAFYDVGEVLINKFNDYPQAADPNNGTLQGAGLSVSWNAPYDVLINATWATRIGNNPFANEQGLDSDGSLDKNRFWLNASVGF